jgi:Putative transposase.
VVFTLPHELNTLVLYNKKELYSCLMQAVWETIKTLGQDPKRLNGLMGMLAILHTWGQNLLSHNHIHCIVPGVAINGDQWRVSKSNYLFPVKAMSKIFRGIFISGLRSLYKKSQLKIPNDPDTKTSLNISKNFDALLRDLMEKPWVVYAKEPFAGPEKLLDYLGRYVNKIAISNNRIISCDEKSVNFKWRDYSDGNKVKVMELKPEEFIRRFLSHVIPTGFIRIRFLGFWPMLVKTKILQ